MGRQAFGIAGDRAVLIANDVTDFRYRAAVHHLPVGAQVAVQCRDNVETHFVLESGRVEFMVGGAVGIVLGGDFVRVPAGRPYAYRNVGDTTACVLMHTASPTPIRRALQLIVGFAA